MPKRTDIQKILIIGSGPIVIGQACEFDYSGSQACKALRADGYEVVLVNSNPATIMTDPELADRTYVEPLTAEYLEAIIEREHPDAILPTVGGQTALNLAVELAEKGILEKHHVRLIGASMNAIKMAEDRLWFKDAMRKTGLEVPRSVLVNNVESALAAVDQIGFPAIIRPSFTLGGTGSAIAYNREEFEESVRFGIEISPVHEVLVEESVLGWKEFELEVMRDQADNAVVVCSIENFDPMGVHTGDSITVAPIQTLTDKEYQRMRDAAFQVIRVVGVETGGSNIQFAVEPETGRMVVIEMNPRVSRSSALASKATGFPIAKIAARLAVGYRLDEIPNDITKKTPSCFEPTIDYVVVKIPKWASEKFPDSDPTLGTQMKSVGEAMAIGRTFKEALMKGIRSLETGRRAPPAPRDEEELLRRLLQPHPERLWDIFSAFRAGHSADELAEITRIDPWFLNQIHQIVEMRDELRRFDVDSAPRSVWRAVKRLGYADAEIAELWQAPQDRVRIRRLELNIRPVFKRVDTCAAEFESFTPYLYSSYETEDEAEPTGRRKIMILGSGPNRIGQGIEFDYCCCHAAFALKEQGYETIMVNCNPETVSTDYDTSDRLYFEPLTFEDVMTIVDKEKPQGVIVQFGGQTPLNLARQLKDAGVPIIGTSPESIELAEDRKHFGALLQRLQIPHPENGAAMNIEEAARIARRIGYPVLIRPSYVLGGRAMVIAYDERTLVDYVVRAEELQRAFPILVDRFLENATEVDVDALADGERVVVAGIMEHIEEAGIHSGDSSCVLPAVQIPEPTRQTLREYTRRLASELGVVGLMNAQYAIQHGNVFVLEVNPRASRTVPYVSKATGVPVAKIAARLMVGEKLDSFDLPDELPVQHYFVKSPVFPFQKFPGVDTILGPEMKSTGEVMGVGESFGLAFAKAQLATGQRIPTQGHVFISVNDHDKPQAVQIGRDLLSLGFKLVATRGTAHALQAAGVTVKRVFKVNEGRPNVVDLIKSAKLDLIINTPLGGPSHFDEKAIRRAAVQHGVPCVTTLSGAIAVVNGIRAQTNRTVQVLSLQDLHGTDGKTAAVAGASREYVEQISRP
ncbi:MAG TPA: carbamoyl-phosphate synthase large subunit [Terriglobia bacterium]|nr:carbamoyl-phosphate synthase large subunit [Terriglobia bacterium]